MFQTLIRDAIPVLALLVSISLCLPSEIESFIFNLQSGRTKCITEDLQINADTHASYRISADSPHNHKISIRVSDPHGEDVHYAQSVESGEFAFTATLDGDYTACFWSPQFDPYALIPIEFDWKAGVATNRFNTDLILKKGNIHFMELELKKLEESVHLIHEDIMLLREREEEMQKLNEATNSGMALMSLLSLVICLAVAGLQLWHLKTFFEKKKIL